MQPSHKTTAVVFFGNLMEITLESIPVYDGMVGTNQLKNAKWLTFWLHKILSRQKIVKREDLIKLKQN